jgi:eukaryotic-like serine/threonine-protein kinase
MDAGARPPATDTGAWGGLLDLLDRALDLPDAPAREAWIAAQALPPDTADALRRLLADHDRLRADGFLEPLTAASVPARPDDEAPQVGPWRLLRPLGEGGMGRVWLAERDDGQVQRQVALKLPHAGPGQSALAARLLRERQLLASLEHPNIARLYDVGLTADGRPYLVMQYVDGEPITAACDRRRLGVDERLAVFRRVLAAVQHAHQRLVLHRDLKPSNILLDAAGQPSLLDFGVARPLDEATAAGTPAHTLTGLHGPPLTPEYAAPEQLAGEPLSTACDVYALGVVLHELLTGRRPHRLPAADGPALARRLRAATPPRPSDAARAGDDPARGSPRHHARPAAPAPARRPGRHRRHRAGRRPHPPLRHGAAVRRRSVAPCRP